MNDLTSKESTDDGVVNIAFQDYVDWLRKKGLWRDNSESSEIEFFCEELFVSFAYFFSGGSESEYVIAKNIIETAEPNFIDIPGFWDISDTAVEKQDSLREKIKGVLKNHVTYAGCSEELAERLYIHEANYLILAFSSREYLRQGNIHETWGAICEAQHASSTVYGIHEGFHYGLGASKDNAIRRMLDARHEASRRSKEALLRWYATNKNKFPSKNRAAAVATTIFGVNWKTARNWLTGDL